MSSSTYDSSITDTPVEVEGAEGFFVRTYEDGGAEIHTAEGLIVDLYAEEVAPVVDALAKGIYPPRDVLADASRIVTASTATYNDRLDLAHTVGVLENTLVELSLEDDYDLPALGSETPAEPSPNEFVPDDLSDDRYHEDVEASAFTEPVASEWEAKRLLESYIALRIPVVLDYTKLGGEEVTRTVSPASIEGQDWLAYVVGFDHEREAFRNFRVSRIRGIGPAAEVFRDE